jgi:hypothetical protein
MNHSIIKSCLWFLLAAAMLFSSSPAFAQQAQAQAKFNPDNITLDVGESIFISVIVEEITGAYGCDVIVNYNPNIVEMIEVYAGGFLEEGFTLINSIDQGKGKFEFAMTQISPSSAKSGNGTLIVFKLKGIANGSSTLQFSRTSIAREDGSLVSLEGNSATIRVQGTSSSSPTQTQTANPVVVQKSQMAVTNTSVTAFTPVQQKPRLERTPHTPTATILQTKQKKTSLPSQTPIIFTPSPAPPDKTIDYTGIFLNILWWVILFLFLAIILILISRFIYLSIKKK